MIPNLPHPDAPDGMSDADNPVVKGPFLPESFAEHQRVPHWESGDRARDPRQRARHQDRPVDVDDAARRRRHAVAGAVPAGARPQRRRLRGGPPADAGVDGDADLDRAAAEVRRRRLRHRARRPVVHPHRRGAAHVDLRRRGPRRGPAPGAVHGVHARATGARPGRPDATRVACCARHEFDKVEILALATAEQAPALLEEMVGRAESTIAALELPYRIIEICTGDMGQTHHRSFDIEVYAPGRRPVARGLVGQLVQRLPGAPRQHPLPAGRRRRPPQKGTQLVHTLNGSALAVPRVWAAIVENYRNADGSITVPTALRPYMRGISTDRIELGAMTTRSVTGGCSTRPRASTSPTSAADPMEQWRRWHGDAFDAGVAEPNAMTLSTVDGDGEPDARMVLVRGADGRGFAFYTNYESVKSRQLDAHPVGRRHVRLARSPPPGPGAGHDRARRPGRERRVLRLAGRGAARSGRGRRPSRSRSRSRAELDARVAEIEAAVRRRTGATPSVLGRLAAAADGMGVLARQDQPTARPVGLPRRSADGWRNRPAGARRPSPAESCRALTPPKLDLLMRTVAEAPALLPQANDPCWCGSGRKYKRCHKRSEGRVLQGVGLADAHRARAHRAPAIRRDRRADPLGRAADQVARDHRAHAPRRQGGGRDPAPHRRVPAPRHDDRRGRRLLPSAVHRARRLPEHAQLQLLSRRACAPRPTR